MMKPAAAAPILTERLTLLPVTWARASASLDGALGERLGARLPASWPPPELEGSDALWCQALLHDPGLRGWLGWYWLLREPEIGGVALVGHGGFIGPARAGESRAEVGYWVAPERRGQGIATEAMRALLGWGGTRGLTAAYARAQAQNDASAKLLIRLGFSWKGEVSPSQVEDVLYEVELSQL